MSSWVSGGRPRTTSSAWSRSFVISKYSPSRIGWKRFPTVKNVEIPSVELEFVLVVDAQALVLLLLEQYAIAGDQHLDIGAHEAAERVLRRAHDRLAAHIEARVDQHRTSGLGLEPRQQR